LKVMSIVLDRNEMREFYRIIDDRIDAYRVSRADKSGFSSFLRDMRYIYNASKADEFVLVFKGVEIESLVNILGDNTKGIGKTINDNIHKLFLNTRRFDNRVHHSASGTATNFTVSSTAINFSASSTETNFMLY